MNSCLRKIYLFFPTQLDMLLTIFFTLIVFFWGLGFSVLDFNNLNLVLSGGDFTNCYLGSVFYRIDEWRWPVLTMQNLGYPYGMSAYGTDIGPLFSFIFKILHKFFGLSPELQFVGLWMLICYVLQAWASVLIFRHAFHNKILIFVSSLFFVTAPIMLNRIFVHINLMPHFLILFPILLWMNNKLRKREWIYIAILYSLAFLTCPYFLPMQTVFFVLLWYQKLFVEKEISLVHFMTGFMSLVCMSLFWMFLLGLFTTGQKLDSGGWRDFGFNLASFVSPVWTKSQFFNQLTKNKVVNYDTDNYLGLGIFLLGLFLFPAIKDLFKRNNLRRHWPLATVLFGLFIFALSPKIRYADIVLVDYNPGKYISWLGNTFRYSARFFWPIWYLLVFFLLKTFASKFKNKAVWLLIPILGIQLWDLYPSWRIKMDFVTRSITQPPLMQRTLKDPKWAELAKKYSTVFYFSTKQYENIWWWAIKNHKNVNYGFLNRPNPKLIKDVYEIRSQILSGYLDSKYKDYLFVLDNKTMDKLKDYSSINPSVKKLASHVKLLDSYHVLEYKPQFSSQKKSLAQPVKISAIHTGWRAELVQDSPYRLYRPLLEDRRDYATIISFNDKELIIDWDLWGKETFKKEKDGKYHFVPKKS